MFVSALKKYKLLPIFIDYYKIDHPRLTINTLKIISAITENKDISLDDLISFNLIQRSISILKEYITKNQEWAYEVLLEINVNFFLKLFESLTLQKVVLPPLDQQIYSPLMQLDSSQQATRALEPIFEIYDSFFTLVEYPDYNVVEKTIKLINYMMVVFG
jgi:hypothetical protein